MEISRFVVSGMLAVSLAAGLAVAQNPLDIKTGGQTQAPPAASVPKDASGAVEATLPTGAVSILNLNRMVDGAYPHSVLRYNPYSEQETVTLEAQLLDRNQEPLKVVVEGGDPSNTNTWLIPRGAFERLSFRIGLEPGDGNDSLVTDSDLGILKSIWAALLSSQVRYGAWTGHLPAHGYLVLTHRPSNAPEAAAAADPSVPKRIYWGLNLHPPLPSKVDKGVLLASFTLAVAATLLAAIIIGASKNSSLGAPIENVSFDLKNSWGTNLALGTAILTLLTSGTVLSQEQYSSNRTTYLLLAPLLAAFVPLGATLYGLIRPSGSAGVRSVVGGYLFASAVVLWGTFGELLLLGMLFRELELASVLTRESAGLLIWMSKGLILFVIAYAALTAQRITREVPTTTVPGVTPASLPMI